MWLNFFLKISVCLDRWAVTARRIWVGVPNITSGSSVPIVIIKVTRVPYPKRSVRGVAHLPYLGIEPVGG